MEALILAGVYRALKFGTWKQVTRQCLLENEIFGLGISTAMF